MTEGGARGSWLRHIGLHRPELRAWALYDWANSAYYTTIVAAVFPLYYNSVAGDGLGEGVATTRLLWANSISAIVVAVLAPILGAAADFLGQKKKLLGAFTLLGILSTALMVFIERGDWVMASILFMAGNIGVASSLICYDSFLPHIAKNEELDRVSSAGYAVGYLGGGILLCLQVLWISNPQWFPGEYVGGELVGGEYVGGDYDAGTLPYRLAFLSVALWWGLFSIPLFLRVPEPPRLLESDERVGQSVLRGAIRRVGETFHELRGYRQAFLLLLALLLYGEGIGTIFKAAASYAEDLDIAQGAVLRALLLTQFIGIPCALLFGVLATRVGARPSIYLALTVYVGVCIFGYFLEGERGFYVLAVLVGMVQGGAQALGRSLFSSMIPSHKSAEFFGFYSLGSKFAGIFGPMMLGVVGTMAGDIRVGFVSVAGFFVAGAVMLSRVDIEEGRRAAREAEAGVRAAVSE